MGFTMASLNCELSRLLIKSQLGNSRWNQFEVQNNAPVIFLSTSVCASKKTLGVFTSLFDGTVKKVVCH